MVAPTGPPVSVVNRIPAVLENFRVARQTAVLNCLLLWRNAMIETVSGSGRGRIYTHKGHTHQASAPGDPPALEFGELAGSINTAMIGDAGIVGSPLRKSLWLERGTRKMAPRPFIARSFMDNRQHLMSILASRWDAGGMNLARGDIRTLTYMAGRLLGDVTSITGGMTGISGIRTGLYQTGRALGDVRAVTGGTMGRRALTRGAGRIAQPSVVGVGGGRVGRRVAGRGAGAGIRQIPEF